MYDSLNRLRSIIRLLIHKDNNDIMRSSQWSKAFSYRHRLYEEHYKGLSTLQEYYGKKLNTSNDQRDQIIIKNKLKFLGIIKECQFYTNSNKIRLNTMREEYLLSKKSSKNDT